MARFLSLIFHPLLMPTYLFLTLSELVPAALDPIPPSSHLLFIGMLFILTFMLPVLNLGILKVFGSVRSFELGSREERLLPFTLITLVYIAITFWFYYKTRIGFNDSFLKLMITIDLLALVATILTYFRKVSIHSLTAWGIIGILVVLNYHSEVNALFVPVLAAVVITGFVMSSRLSLQAHSLWEVLSGGIAGLITSVAAMVVFFGK